MGSQKKQGGTNRRHFYWQRWALGPSQGVVVKNGGKEGRDGNDYSDDPRSRRARRHDSHDHVRRPPVWRAASGMLRPHRDLRVRLWRCHARAREAVGHLLRVRRFHQQHGVDARVLYGHPGSHPEDPDDQQGQGRHDQARRDRWLQELRGAARRRHARRLHPRHGLHGLLRADLLARRHHALQRQAPGLQADAPAGHRLQPPADSHQRCSAIRRRRLHPCLRRPW